MFKKDDEKVTVKSFMKNRFVVRFKGNEENNLVGWMVSSIKEREDNKLELRYRRGWLGLNQQKPRF